MSLLGKFRALLGGDSPPAAAARVPLRLDPAFGDPRVHHMRGQLERGEWPAVEQTLTAIRDGDDRAFVVGALAEVPGRPAWLDRWVEASPQSAAARLVRGANGIEWAWEARGGGQAEAVGKDRWPVFFERLRQAEEDLGAAAAADPRDPTPWAFLVTSARGAQIERPQVEQRFQEAVRRDPASFRAHVHLLWYLCKKWFGSHEEMFRFARSAAGQAPAGSRLPTLVAMAHVERWLYQAAFDRDREGAARYFAAGAVVEEIRAAADRSIAQASFPATRGTLVDRNFFAFCFWQMGDGPRLAAELAKIGRHVHEFPWAFAGNPVQAFERARGVQGKPRA